MLQTLFHIPLQIAGQPVFGFGLLLAAWAVFGVGLMVWLVRRQGWTADTWSYVPLWLVVAAAMVWVLPHLCDAEGLPIRGYGVMVLTAVVAGLGLLAWRAERGGEDQDMGFSLAFWMILPGIVGARVFYVAEYWHEQFWPAYGEQGLRGLVIAIVNVTQGGLVVYGAFVGGVVGFLAFYWKYRIRPLPTFDLLAPSLMLGLALGRVGCLLNGCCFGGHCDLPWGVTFPRTSPPYMRQLVDGELLGFTMADADAGAVVETVRAGSPAEAAGLHPLERVVSINGQPVLTADEFVRRLVAIVAEEKPSVTLELSDGQISTIYLPPRSLRVHPTQIYAAVDAFLLCLVLLAYDRFFRRRDGELTAVLLTLYPIVRFVEEMIRTDEPKIAGTGMTPSQNVSVAMLAVGIGLWFYILRQQGSEPTARQAR
jgi:phosphatidylglycerol---prolipoprotein diacylglyceryl transferase